LHSSRDRHFRLPRLRKRERDGRRDANLRSPPQRLAQGQSFNVPQTPIEWRSFVLLHNLLCSRFEDQRTQPEK
jgi:hypothetical protein